MTSGDAQSSPSAPDNPGRADAELLRAHGFAVDWHAYPMAHQVCSQEIGDLGDWLDARFAAR